MVTENLAKSVGVVNGSMGVVRGYHWKAGHVPRTNLLEAVLVELDDYQGQHTLEMTDLDGIRRKVVPITAVTREFFFQNKPCWRRQFPLQLAWAVTVHKAQGLTLEKVVLEISGREFSAGLIYTAISRVRSLKDILFEESFDFGKLSKGLNTEYAEARDHDTLRRMAQ